MKELKEEARRHEERKLHAYGGKCRAHGGRAEHSDIKEDEALIKKEVKPEALKHKTHKADGGPIMGGSKMPSLGRHRRGGPGKGKTNVNVIMAGKPGGDAGPGAGPMPPIGGPAMPPPRPAMPPMPPRPPVGMAPGAGPAGPMKRGGEAKKPKKHHGHHEHHESHKGAHH